MFVASRHVIAAIVLYIYTYRRVPLNSLALYNFTIDIGVCSSAISNAVCMFFFLSCFLSLQYSIKLLLTRNENVRKFEI